MIRMVKDGVVAEVQTELQAYVFERNGYVREEKKVEEKIIATPKEETKETVKRGRKPRQ